MARTCTICRNKQRAEIDKALVEGHPYRSIAKQFSVSEPSLWRHKADDLLEAIVRANDAKLVAEATDVLGALVVYKKRMDMLLDACDEWLRDPDDPSKYNIGPRAEDVEATYFSKNGDGKQHRKKELLSSLIERAGLALSNENNTLDFELVEVRRKDPRDLIIATQAEVRKTLELVAELQGKLSRQPQVNVLLAPEFVVVREAVMRALRPHAEAREAVVKALEEVEE